MTSSANHGFGRVPDAFLDTLKDRTDVVALIGRRVELKKAGATYKGLCPFHSEKSPSFTVSPSRQTYHCFGCGMHGGALSFLMEYEGTPFREAVEALAAEAGIALPAEMTGSGTHSVDTKPLFAAMERAARFYRYSLGQSEEAKAYLKSRGVIKETLNRFCIGFAPAGWRNLREAFSDYERNQHILDCGLVREKKADAHEGSGTPSPSARASRYDCFRRRITFGVRNSRGQLVAFGGRVIDPEEGPKYLNSAESAIFDKSSTLFGLYEAREHIRTKREALVVEGYMDVVMLSQSGVRNVVAAMGTAFTRLHLERLLSTTSRIIYAFDGDAAGRQAAWRALETTMTVLEDEHDFRFLLLPSGLDPDELVQQEGLNAFEARAGKALSLSEFMVRELTERHNGLATPEDRARFESEATEIVLKISFKTKLRRILLSHIAAEARSPGSTARAIRSAARPRPTRKTVWAALTEAARRAPATAANLAQTIVPLLDLSAPDEAAFCQLLTDLARQAGTPSSDVADEVIARDTLHAAVDMIVGYREEQAKADLVRQFNAGELDEASYLRKRQAMFCS
ncbi:DNA primase [Pelomonas sp. APW6]|uniref:DNA primase n=1 Tax=Roseateles subflavus TaxID=3053353 RepID=A0ABT7LNB9_9BURK|nr:DNA primase [Pelomonas sp. APW6]MDL5034372.1 DNA primase [Pelomonas sp. APW6]